MDLPDTIDAIRLSTVQISIRQPQGESPPVRPIGTGFFVGEQGHVITAKHVVDAAQRAQVTVGLALPNGPIGGATFRSGFSIFDANVIASDPSKRLSRSA